MELVSRNPSSYGWMNVFEKVGRNRQSFLVRIYQRAFEQTSRKARLLISDHKRYTMTMARAIVER